MFVLIICYVVVLGQVDLHEEYIAKIHRALRRPFDYHLRYDEANYTYHLNCRISYLTKPRSYTNNFSS